MSSLPSESSTIILPSAEPSGEGEGGPGDGGMFWDNSLSFSIIPVIIVVVAVAVVVGLCIRRRRAGRGNAPNWSGISSNDIERANRRNGTGTGPRRAGRTWAVWRNDDSLGLDEHGEAPPAYAVKAQPGQSLATGIPVRGDTVADLQTSYELDDMRRPRQGEASSSSSSSPPPLPPSSPIATPAQTHLASGAAEPPPPEYGTVTAGSQPPPPDAPHPSEISESNAASTTDAPLITTPPPAVSIWRSRGN